MYGNLVENNGHPNASIAHQNVDPGYGIATNNGSGPFKAVVVNNNILIGNKRKGIDGHSAVDFTAVGNIVTDTAHGINIYAGVGGVLGSATVVGNQVKRVANAKGSNTIGISVVGSDASPTTKVLISGNNLEEIGVPPAIVDTGDVLSTYSIHAANANLVSISGNTVHNETYIGLAGIVVPQTATQPVTNAIIVGNTVTGKYNTGFIGTTTADTHSRPFLIGNRFSLTGVTPYTNVPVGISAAAAMLGLNAISLPDVAGAELTDGTQSTGMLIKITVVISSGVITHLVDSNFELFGKTPITSVASAAAGVRISLASWLPPARNVEITRKQQIIKRLTGNTLINRIYEHDVSSAYIDIGLCIEDYTANTSTFVAGNNADGVFVVYIGF
jgi:hypothetical protein